MNEEKIDLLEESKEAGVEVNVEMAL